MPAPGRVPFLALLAGVASLADGRRTTELAKFEPLEDDDDGEEKVKQDMKSDVVAAVIVTDDCHTWTGGYNGDVVEWGCSEVPDLPYKTVHEIRRYQHSSSPEHPRAVRALLLMGAVMFSGGDDGRVVGYSVFEGRPVVTIDVKPRAIVQALATDGITVYIGTYDGLVHAYDTDLGEVDRCRKYGSGTVNALGYPQGGDLLYVGGTDGAIDVWYLNSNEWELAVDGECPIEVGENATNATEVLESIEGGNPTSNHSTGRQAGREVGPVVTSFATAGVGRTLYSASVDGVIRAWDTGTGENVGYMTLPNMNKINALVITKDGHTLFSGGDNVAFRWEITTHLTDNTTSKYWITGSGGTMFSYGDEIRAMAIDEKDGRLVMGGKGGEAMAFDMVNGTWLYRMWHKQIDWNDDDPLSHTGMNFGLLEKKNATEETTTATTTKIDRNQWVPEPMLPSLKLAGNEKLVKSKPSATRRPEWTKYLRQSLHEAESHWASLHEARAHVEVHPGGELASHELRRAK